MINILIDVFITVWLLAITGVTLMIPYCAYQMIQSARKDSA
jgi:hypothetical protein